MKTENDLTQIGMQPSDAEGDYQSDYEEAWSYFHLGLFEDALAMMEKWRGQGRPGTMGLILRTLLVMKQYERAAKEGRRMRSEGVGYDADGAFELAVALNACGRHHEARGIWLEADKMDERPAFLVGLACELTYLGRTHAALRQYCLAITLGFEPTLYDLGDPDLAAIWEYAATNETAINETAVLAAPFWDPFIRAALARNGLPNQGHATIGALEPDERKMLAWDALKATFVISAVARKKNPEQRLPSAPGHPSRTGIFRPDISLQRSVYDTLQNISGSPSGAACNIKVEASGIPVAALAGQGANRRMEKPQGGLFRETGTMCGLRPDQKYLRGYDRPPLLIRDGGFFVHAIPSGNFNGETTNEQTRNPGPGGESRPSPLEQQRHLVVPLHRAPARLHEAAGAPEPAHGGSGNCAVLAGQRARSEMSHIKLLSQARVLAARLETTLEELEREKAARIPKKKSRRHTPAVVPPRVRQSA